MARNKGFVLFSINDICTILRDRQSNQYDANFGVSGRRGDGKSTLILKLLLRFKKDGFNQEKHQVYERSDVMNLLSKQKMSFCWDDEAINSGYKRDFQNKGQHELIKLVTNYRDNFNIYASALPFFFSLDRDLRELVFMHIHVIERGLAVIFMQKQDQIHSLDPWDTKYNQKIEESESKRLGKNPLARMRYDRFSTFAGFLHFGDVTNKQRKKYLEIKHRKRAERFEEDTKDKDSFDDKVYGMMIEGKLSKDGLVQMCFVSNTKYSVMVNRLNRMLKDHGISDTSAQFIKGFNPRKEKSDEAKGVEMSIPVFN